MRIAALALSLILSVLIALIVIAVAWDFLSSALYKAGQ